MKRLTREFLIGRGWCCGNGCTNCPYDPKCKKGSTNLDYSKENDNLQKKEDEQRRKNIVKTK